MTDYIYRFHCRECGELHEGSCPYKHGAQIVCGCSKKPQWLDEKGIQKPEYKQTIATGYCYPVSGDLLGPLYIKEEVHQRWDGHWEIKWSSSLTGIAYRQEAIASNAYLARQTVESHVGTAKRLLSYGVWLSVPFAIRDSRHYDFSFFLNDFPDETVFDNVKKLVTRNSYWVNMMTFFRASRLAKRLNTDLNPGIQTVPNQLATFLEFPNLNEALLYVWKRHPDPFISTFHLMRAFPDELSSLWADETRMLFHDSDFYRDYLVGKIEGAKALPLVDHSQDHLTEWSDNDENLHSGAKGILC